ncbi:hypothetical protein JNM87_03520 [Candidatus Saccharibacteria bacterium]|nr:hypothetical protein [Candidatus Saccharibacteria bacterium]
MKITFDDSLRDFVLASFGVAKDEDGYLAEADNPAQRVLTRDGREIEFHKFGGVRKGSEVFIRDDIVSLIQFCEDTRV